MAPSTDYARYLPPLLVDRFAQESNAEISSAPRRIEGAVVTADLTGFSTLASILAGRGPQGAEQLSLVLDATFGELLGSVHRHGGQVLQFAGDAILALWQTDAETSPQQAIARACRCTLDFHQALRDVRVQDAIGDATLQAHAGVAWGEIVFGCAGGVNGRWKFLVGGAPITAAGAAASGAEPGQTLVAASSTTVLGTSVRGEKGPDGCLRVVSVDDLPDLPPRCLVEPPMAALAFVPRSVLTRLQAGQGEWLAEFRQASVLFTSLGTPELAESDAFEQLHQVVRVAQEVVYAFDGSVVQVVTEAGDPTLVAAWGQPLNTHEDDAARAVAAAQSLSQRLAERGVTCRSGIATGRVFCGDRGSRERCEYALIGDVVNLAARLMQASSGDVLCDEPTHDAASRRHGFVRLAPMKLKGQSREVAVYRPVGRASHKAARHSNLHGRSAERLALGTALEALLEGKGGLVLLEGEAGIGKSLLLSRLLEQAADAGVRCFKGGGEAIEAGASYHAWGLILDSVLGVGAGDSREQRSERLLEALREEPDLLERAPLLGAVLPLVLAETTTTRRLQGAARASATEDLICRLLTDLGDGPALVALEDVHWLDAASCGVALSLLRSGAPVLVALTTRPLTETSLAEQRELASWPAGTQLKLDVLDPADTLLLVQERLGVDELSQAVADWICDKSGGNPFFAEQLAFALRDSGVLVTSGRRGRLADQVRDLESVDFPVTIEGVLQSRIDRLDPSDSTALKVGSVIGREFELRLLSDVLSIGNEERPVEQRLEAMANLNLVEKVTGEGATAYRFVHALAQDSCYQSLLYSQRRQLHSAVAEWIEHEYSDDRSVVYPLLAHHWRLAEDGPRACKYAERAGVQAIRSGAHRAGAAYYSGALALFEAEPEGLAAYVDKERRAHWEGQLGVALHALGDFPRAEDHLLRSLRLRGQPHPRSGAAWGVAALRGAARQVAHRFHLLRLGQRPTLSEPAMAAQRLCEKYFFERQFVPMLGSSLMAVNLAERAGRFENLARSYAMLSVIGGVCRLSPVARSYYRRATEVAEEHDDLPGRVFNGYARCVTLCGTGHFQEGRAAALEVLALSETLGDPQEIEMVHAALANNHYFTGGFERMVEHHAQVRESAQRRGSALHEAWGSYGAALGLIALRRLDEAETLIRQALVLLLESSERVSEHICRGLLADIHLERGNWDDAVEQAELAESLIRQSPPSLFTEIEGYAAVARVRLALWERALASQQADVPSLRARAHRSLSALGQFAFLFPIGRPRRLTLGARALRLDGSRRKARRKARRAIHSAQRLGMPYEEALARRELARSLPVDAAETGAQMGAVDELLADMGCAFSGTELSR